MNPNNPKIYGLDLGTTNSVLSVLSEGRPRVVPIEGENLVPSVVSWDGSEMLVGRRAWNRAAAFPEDSVLSVKRAMGSDRLFTLGGKEYRPEEISALILSHLRGQAARVGEIVERVVITVPAYFSDAQRRATLEAGRLAGLTVERLINEPTAAALFYDQLRLADEGAGRDQAPWRHALVYDLGGGTFDVSVLRLGDLVEVLASTGDTALGGDDFDALLAGRLIDQISERGGPDLHAHRPALARLTRAAERAKIGLSQRGAVRIEEARLPTPDGSPAEIAVEISREGFESLTGRLADRTLEFVDQALAQAGLRPDDIDRVLLVGGMTRMPGIAKVLEEKFGAARWPAVDPDQSVALGAAVQGGLISGEKLTQILVDVTAHSLSLAALEPDTHELKCQTIIPRNTPLPAVRSRLFQTAVRHQKKVDLEVYQGESPEPEDNALIGVTQLHLAPAEIFCPIEVEYAYDLNGIVHLTAEQKGYSRRTEISFDSRHPQGRGGQDLDLLDGADDSEEAAPSTQPSTGTNFVIRRARTILERREPGPEREVLAGLLAAYETALARDADELDDLEDELLAALDAE